MGTRFFGFLVCVGASLVIFVFVAVLSGYELGKSAETFLYAGLPNWIQAIATGAAGYFAWNALTSWKQQELMRTRAAEAPKILRMAYACEQALRSVRREGGCYSTPLTVKNIRLLVKDAVAQLKDAQGFANELRSHVGIIRIVFDPKTALAIEEVLECFYSLASAASVLDLTTRGLEGGGPAAVKRAEDNPTWQPAMMEFLETLGYQNVTAGNEAYELARADKWSKSLEAAMKNLERLLEERIKLKR